MEPLVCEDALIFSVNRHCDSMGFLLPSLLGIPFRKGHSFHVISGFTIPTDTFHGLSHCFRAGQRTQRPISEFPTTVRVIDQSLYNLPNRCSWTPSLIIQVYNHRTSIIPKLYNPPRTNEYKLLLPIYFPNEFLL